MVKKILFALILINLFGLLKVNASTVGGYEADSPLYAVVSSNYNNVPVRLWTPNIFGSDVVDYGNVVNDYVYITACTDMPTLGYSYTPFYNNTTGNTASATDIRYTANLTSKICTFNTGAQGKVAYIKFRLISDLLNVPQGFSSSTWLYNDYITFYIGTNSPFSFSIQNISALDVDLDIYSNDFDFSLLEQQNQQIINNQNNNTNTITQNQDENTQDIIDNQNQNTDKEIESQKVCFSRTYNNDSFPIMKYNNYMLPDKTFVSNSSWNVTDYISVLKDKTYTYTISQTYPGLSDVFLLFDNNKNFVTSYGLTNSTTYTFNPSTDGYIVINLFKSSNRISSFSGEFCENGNQVLNDSVNGLNDSITSEDTPNTNQDIQDMDNMVASDTPISDLITMPLTLINSYINGVNSSCSPINLGNLYGTNLTLPCINLEQRLGTNLWHIIDSLFSLFMCYNIGMLFITAFDGLTSLRDDFEVLYQPRHADTGYQPRHGGGS